MNSLGHMVDAQKHLLKTRNLLAILASKLYVPTSFRQFQPTPSTQDLAQNCAHRKSLAHVWEILVCFFVSPLTFIITEPSIWQVFGKYLFQTQVIHCHPNNLTTASKKKKNSQTNKTTYWNTWSFRWDRSNITNGTFLPDPSTGVVTIRKNCSLDMSWHQALHPPNSGIIRSTKGCFWWFVIQNRMKTPLNLLFSSACHRFLWSICSLQNSVG